MKDHGPAFPQIRTISCGSEEECEGLQIRDYFAAKAMQAIINADRIRGQTSAHDYKNECARDSYNMADAMLRAREESE